MRPHRLPVLFWAAVTVYVALTVLVATGTVDGLDHAVLRFCDRHRQSTVTAFADHFTNLFSPAPDTAYLGIGAGVVAWLGRRPAVFLVAAVTELTMTAVVLLSKEWVARPLPHTPAPGHGGGFPSGHTAAFLVCFGALALLATTRRRGWRLPSLAAVGLATAVVAASLVYDDYHWLTDTLGSISLGVAILTLLARRLSTVSGRREASRTCRRRPAPARTPR